MSGQTKTEQTNVRINKEKQADDVRTENQFKLADIRKWMNSQADVRANKRTEQTNVETKKLTDKRQQKQISK